MDFVEKKVIEYLSNGDIIEHCVVIKENTNTNSIIDCIEKPETDEEYCL